MDTLRDTTNYHETSIKRVSWPAIFAGTLIMLITLMLLSLLGVGIGLGSINPMEELKPMEGLGTGALIWWVISNLIAVFAGSYAAANLTNLPYKMTGIYHGVLSWSLFTLISFWLMTTAVGGIISGVGGVVSKSLSAMGMGVSEIASSVGQGGDTDRIKQMIQQALQKNGGSGDTTEFDIDVMAVVQDVFFVEGELRTDVERGEVEQSIADNSTLTGRDVGRATDVVMQKYQEAKLQWMKVKLKAPQAAQEAASAGSRAAIWAFVALVLGAITAAIGGKVGRPDVADVDLNKRRSTFKENT